MAGKLKTEPNGNTIHTHGNIFFFSGNRFKNISDVTSSQVYFRGKSVLSLSQQGAVGRYL